MPWLCLKCESRTDRKITNLGKFMCPICGDLTKDEVYRVGKRWFSKEREEFLRERSRIRRKKIKGLKRKQKQRERRKHDK